MTTEPYSSAMAMENGLSCLLSPNWKLGSGQHCPLLYMLLGLDNGM